MLARRLERRLGVVGEERRHLHRDPAVGAARALMDGPEQIGGAAQILEREFHEQRFALEARAGLLPDAGVIERGAADGLIEDGGIGGEPGHGELVDVAAQRAIVEYAAGDVVEPQALPQIVQLLRDSHARTSRSDKIESCDVADSLDHPVG